MGLDMYLYRKHFVWSSDAGELKITGLKSRVNGAKVRYIIEEAGYWRKANHIHSWFVNNVQNGEDDCGTYYVSKEQLVELRNLCQEVVDNSKLVDGKQIQSYSFNEAGEKIPNYIEGKIIEDPSVAQELLPTTEGFFFGGTEYDEWYLNDVKDTIKICDEALASDEDHEYHSSW